MLNVVATITSDISSRLAGLPVAMMLANTFLVNARSHVDSLLTWIESFYQELQQGGNLRRKNLGYWYVLAYAAILKSCAKYELPLKLLQTWLLLLIV